MALSRELTRRLEFEEEPLAKRLKLAENAFACTYLPVTRKEDLVLKWLNKVAEKDKNVWNTLKHCLKYKNNSSNIVLKSEVKQLLVETLITTFSNGGKDLSADTVECCELLFANCEIQQYFQSKPQSFVEFIKALQKIVSETSENSKPKDDCSITNSVCKCAAVAIETFISCYKQSLDKNELTEIFLCHILYPICRLIDKNESNRLGAEIHKCIQQLFFGKLRYSQFKEFNNKDENNIAKRIFDELKHKAAIDDENISLIVFSYVFRAAVGSYKTDPSIIDLIFRNLINSAGSLKIKLVNCLRQQLTNVTFDYQNKINDETLFAFLQNVIDEILSIERLSSAEYEALACIAVLNPLIIETKIQDVLKKILLEKKETLDECESYEKLMTSILEAGVRLRREQKLVPWILSAIKETLTKHKSNDLDINAVFPNEFKEQFTKSVTNMTSMQTIGVFRSLIFHLNQNCVESTENNKSALIFLLQANVDLMAAFFNGVRIFDHTVPLAGKEKFVQALKDLRNILSQLTDKVLNTKRNKKLITPLLTVTWYWDNLYNWMKHYSPDAVTDIIEFPISDNQMQRFFDCIDNSGCKRSMNRILVQRISRNMRDETCFDVSGLLDGLEESWFIILDQNPQIISFMDNKQIAEMSRLLLIDSKSFDTNSLHSFKRLNSECVKNNERFVKALVCQIFVDVAANINQSCTKFITEHINVIKVLDRGKVSKIFKDITKRLTKKEWQYLNESSISLVKENLEILQQLPLMHLNRDFRTLIFFVVYSIEKECSKNDVILELCTDITLDISEHADIDIFEYIEPETLINDVIRNRGTKRIFEISLTNISSWESIKTLIKNSKVEDNSVSILLDCIEGIKSKLKSNQKEILRKAERKLGKKLLDVLKAKSNDEEQEIKFLTRALKISVTDDEIPYDLIDFTKLTVNRIFGKEKLTINDKSVAEITEFITNVLKRRSKFVLNDDIVRNIWSLVFANPCKNLILPLLDITGSKILNKILAILHTKTISGLQETDYTSFQQAFVIWNLITNSGMAANRDKLRIAAIINVLETLEMSVIPVHCWQNIMGFVQTILSKHSHAIQKGIDVILLLAARSLREIEFTGCENVITICSLLVKYKLGFITDRLPVLLSLYRQIVRIIIRESRKDLDESLQRQLRCLSLEIEKFTNALVKLKKDLARISPYIIADLVEMFSEGVIPSFVKEPLEQCVGHFLSICDQHGISLLSRTLPTSSQEIFKSLYETYNKFQKFTGKI